MNAESRVKAAHEFMRFYGDMRFKQLAFYGVLAGLLVNAMRATDSSGISSQQIALGGLVVTAVAWVMEVRSTKQWVSWKMLGSGEAASGSSVPVAAGLVLWLNATNAVLVFYALAYLFWEQRAQGQLTAGIVGESLSRLCFWVLVGFSAIEYLPLWWNSFRWKTLKGAWEGYVASFRQ